MELWGEGMTQLGDIDHVERELEAFRARTQDALKSFDRLEELISEFTENEQAYEREVASAAEIADLLKDKLKEIDQNWLHLKSEIDAALEHVNRSEIERERRWVQYNKNNKKAQDELRASWQEFQAQLKQMVADLKSDSELHLLEAIQGFDSQAARLDDLQNAFEQRSAMLDEGLTKMKNGLIAADRNLRTEFEQMITDLRVDSERHFAEVNQGLDSQATSLDDLQNAFEQRSAMLDEGLTKMKNGLIAADRNLRTELEQMITDLRVDSDERWSKLQEKAAAMQKKFQAAHGDLRTTSWKMADDLRSEAEDRFSDIDKSLAARVEEINESTEARILEANNRQAGELEASRQEFREGLSVFEQRNAVMGLRIERLQRMIWALLAVIIIVVIIIIYTSY
jgi:chromosome segregation ATPase